MVVFKKISASDAAEMEEEGINDTSSDDEMLDTETNDMAEEVDKLVEPARKKVKRDVTKEAEKELIIYDAIVKDTETKFTEKLSKVSFYLNSVFQNNVNTLEFESNFNDWMKRTLLLLLEEGTVASNEFYEFICNVLKVSPTIVESTCEKILTFIFTQHNFTPECNRAFETFMENLSYTFEKLRRYPKLIAKLLCCVRENINDMNERKGPTSTQKIMKKLLVHKSKDKSVFILPKRFMNSYASIISMLSAGQIVDLWKTLHHNLEEECIKKKASSISGAVPMTCFLTVVVDLTATFLCSIKVADYSVPVSTVEKVVDMMNKLRLNSIPELSSSLPSDYDAAYTCSFLKLCNAWSHLHHFMCIYNENYTNSQPECSVEDVQQAVDLSILFPQLSSAEWVSLWTKIQKNKDTYSISLMVNLVALKLKCLAVILQKQRNEGHHDSTENVNGSLGNENELLQRNVQETAKFLWNHQQALKFEEGSGFINSCEDTLRITTAYLHQDELLEYAKIQLDNVLESGTQIMSNVPYIQSFHQQLSSNMKFRVAVVLESLQEGIKRVGKGTSSKRQLKKFLTGCLNPICKTKVLKGLELTEGKVVTLDEELKKSLMEAVLVVNNMMKTEANQDSEDQISPTLLGEIISLVGREELSQYPTPVKTLIFLSFLLIFTAMINHCKEPAVDLYDEISSVLSECGRNSQGNDVLFHVKWTELFYLVKSNANFLSEKGMKSLCSLTLENIYVSPKTATDFGDQHIKNVGKDGKFDMMSAEGYLNLCILEHILEEAIVAKSKSTLVLTSHAQELCSVVLNKLSDGSVITDLHGIIHSLKKINKKNSAASTKKTKLPDFGLISRALRSCYLLLKGKSYMSQDDASEVGVIILPYLQFALDHLEWSSKSFELLNDQDNSTAAMITCAQLILEALKNFQEYRKKLPKEFLVRVWNSLCNVEHRNSDEIGRKVESELPRLILEASDEQEFQSICDSIVDLMSNEKLSAITARVLSNLISAETPIEKKKQIRRSTIELSLYKYLEHINLWRESDDFVQSAIPYIHFQISLLKRRRPMGSLSTLSVCLSSVTSLPLDRIKSIESFKTIFSVISDLLNAYNVHRLDVLAFRSHVFVQCFQFLVEHLVSRADQTNKLTDKEIYDLRHCAHCIERICQSAKLGREELGRVSPYLVVILLQQFEKTTVYPTVKNPLLNGCYKLLDMCDDHGVSHVNSMLSTGSREIFKSIFELYKKFYKYKGKV